jgi:integrase
METKPGRVAFTAGRVDGHTCPAGKLQAFLWDSTAPGLGLRTTATGAKAYVFQSEFQGKTLRMTIGSPDAWTIPKAQRKARELQTTIDDGRDPRAVKAEKEAIDAAARQSEKLDRLTVAEVWDAYIAERRPLWSELHFRDHVRMAKAGGDKPKSGIKGGKLTVAGPLHSLMATKLRDLDADAIEAWAKKEAKGRKTSARLAWRLLRAFLGWCSEHKEYAHLLPATNPAATKKSREALGEANAKKDVLQREQLAAWFDAVGKIDRPAVSAYVRILLLTGARPGELLNLKWADVNAQWKSIAIRDKVEGERLIPLTPYVAHLLAGLPRRSDWVFTIQRTRNVKSLLRTSKDDGRTDKPKAEPVRMAIPQKLHVLACKAAGIEGLTFHGLRRSFASLTEWLEVPAGVVAQIMGHKPSATAEKHYKVRPLELLRMHHERIEAWMLEQAGVKFDPAEAAQRLRLVTA